MSPMFKASTLATILAASVAVTAASPASAATHHHKMHAHHAMRSMHHHYAHRTYRSNIPAVAGEGAPEAMAGQPGYPMVAAPAQPGLLGQGGFLGTGLGPQTGAFNQVPLLGGLGF